MPIGDALLALVGTLFGAVAVVLGSSAANPSVWALFAMAAATLLAMAVWDARTLTPARHPRRRSI